MEKKKKVKNNKTQANKINRKYPKFLCDFFVFYRENLKKKHIIVYIISLILFFLFLVMFISSLDVTTSIEQLNINNSQAKNTFIDMLKQSVPAIFLAIFAGITPFVYLPVIGFIYPYILAGDIASYFLVSSHTGNLIFMTIGAIIQIFAMSLAMVTGFDYCSLSSKKFRYSQRSSFGLYNVKKQIYEIRKDEKSIEKLEENKRKKDEKIEKLNVSVPYKSYMITFIVAAVISVIGTLIASI